MPKAKTARIAKTKSEDNILHMPENGGSNGAVNRVDLEGEIRVRAYELYAERGYSDGQAESDWFQAERQVLARHGNQKQHSA